MKKLLLVGLSMMVAISSFAQNSPLITMTAEADGSTRTFSFGSAVDNNTISIDWGDGKIVKGATANQFDGSTTTDITGTPVSNGEIKIYTTGAINYLEAVSKVDAAGITSLDVSKAVELTKLYVNGNKLTTLDLKSNTALTRLYANNNSLRTLVLPSSVTYINVQNNSLETFDASAVPNLTYLHIANNKLTTLDFSSLLSIASIYAQDNLLTTFTLGANKTNKLLVNVSGNQLSTLDVTEATGLGTTGARLFAQNNNLTEIKYATLTTANLSGNKFKLSTLPQQNITTLTYAPQQALEVMADKGVVDLTSEYMVNNTATTYTWYNADKTLIPAGDYKEEAGKFTFNKPYESAYCVLANTTLGKFTGTNAFRTVLVKIQDVTTGITNPFKSASATGDIYNVNGTLVTKNAGIETLGRGIYIVKNGNKTIKIVK